MWPATQVCGRSRRSQCAAVNRQHEWLQQEVSPSHISMPPPVLADGRRESGAAAFARLAVLESIDKPRSMPRTHTGERSSQRSVGSGAVSGVVSRTGARVASWTRGVWRRSHLGTDE